MRVELFDEQAVVPRKRGRAIGDGLIVRGRSARSACRLTGLARSLLQYHRRRPVPDREIRRMIVARTFSTTADTAPVNNAVDMAVANRNCSGSSLAPPSGTKSGTAISPVCNLTWLTFGVSAWSRLVDRGFCRGFGWNLNTRIGP